LIRQICADFIKISLARAYNKCPVFCCFSAENITKLTKSLRNFYLLCKEKNLLSLQTELLNDYTNAEIAQLAQNLGINSDEEF
ncbi:MAG: hypothetical protein LBN95_10730, partial [Prevotellaceae bacterium]|nr:hypothetical protein [Prevotellaceae bacterium]